MKVGIMGGTFDPIHNGHLLIARAACSQFGLDEVWFMPNGNPPHKLLTEIGSDAVHRTQMVRLAIGGYDRFRLESCEADRKEVSCSYKTMEHLKKAHPEDEFFFIIGADSLFSIEKWVHPEKLFNMCTILAAYRDGKEPAGEERELAVKEEMAAQAGYLRNKYGARIEMIRSRPFHVSSSELRQRIRCKKDIHGLVPEKVEKYIAEEGLYES